MENEIYCLEKGLRLVKPYPHTFRTHVKERWQGKPLLAVLCKEFEAYSKDYFREAIDAGRIRIDGTPADVQQILQNGQMLEHEALIHEPPVHDWPIKYCGEAQLTTGSIFAVEKPCGLPIHPGAAYRQNCLMSILRNGSRISCSVCRATEDSASSPPEVCECLAAFPAKTVSAVHRLDRLTSGIVAFVASAAVAKECENIFRMGRARKIYIARVAGNLERQARKMFGLSAEELTQLSSEGIDMCGPPVHKEAEKRASPRTVNAADAQQFVAGVFPSYTRPPGGVVIRGYVESVNRKLGIQRHSWLPVPSSNGKTAETTVVMVESANSESLVLLRPKTGRTHQLRVALQAMKCPISNDPCYGPDPLLHPEWIPPTPHVQLEGDRGTATPQDKKFHVAGIFLHAWKLQLGDEGTATFSAGVPDWCFGDQKKLESMAAELLAT